MTCDVIIYEEENSEYDISLRDSDKFKLLQQKAIELCELPRGGLAATMQSKKKAMELRYTVSPSKLCFMSCALLQNHSRYHK